MQSAMVGSTVPETEIASVDSVLVTWTPPDPRSCQPSAVKLIMSVHGHVVRIIDALGFKTDIRLNDVINYEIKVASTAQ
jgi:hypothetical protein